MVKNCNGKPWSYEENIILYNLKNVGKSYIEIAKIMSTMPNLKRHYTPNMLQKKYTNTDWNNLFKTENKRKKGQSEQNYIKQEKIEILRKTIISLQKKLRREKARTEIIIDAMKSTYYRLPKPAEKEISYKAPENPHYRFEHAAIIISDAHVGLSHTLKETGGLSEYNTQIFLKRAELLKKRVLEIIERHRHMYDIPELHVFCLGDIVAGMNDAGAWNSNYMDEDILGQVWEGFSCLRNIIATWSKNFKKLHFYGIYGNHGRVGRKGQEKYHVNWDRICYEFLKSSLQEYSNINWHIPLSWFLNSNILGKNFYLFHGDGIKGTMGIPYYGVERAERNIVSMLPEKIDYFILGHFHSPAELQTNNGRIIMNGSWIGGDIYSLKDLRRMDRPEQKMFGIHEKRGITWMYNIDLSND